MRKKRIGMVGVGRMGANMARRLHDKGYEIVAVHDIRGDAAGELAEELGGKACPTPAHVTASSEIIFTVVTDDEAMEAVFSGAGDSLLEKAEGRIFLNCATVSPAIHERVEQRVQAAGADVLEVCMASSITQAREGTLYLMIGGQRNVFRQVESLLADLSGSMRFVGPTGSAAKVKALVNMVMNINTAGLAEGLALGDALGLDLTLLREVFSQTGADSRVLQTDGEDMQNRDHSCFFSAAHAAKDSGIALDLAQAEGLSLPLAAATKAQYERMMREGLGELAPRALKKNDSPSLHPRKGLAGLGCRNRQCPGRTVHLEGQNARFDIACHSHVETGCQPG